MKIIHFSAGLEEWNGMANTARQFVDEERGLGHDSILTNSVQELESHLKTGVDRVCIHGAWLPVLWKASKLTKRHGAELYIRPAGSYDPVRLAYHGWKKRLVAPFEHRMLRRADVLLATCEAEVEWIRAYAPLVKEVEITDLKRFFNLSRVESGGVSSRVERVDRVEREALHLLYLGRRHPLKGVEYLEAAVAELNLNSVNPVNPVQNTSPRPQIELRIVSNAFGEEKEKVWEWCDVLVLPTLSENFGRVVAEALERGKRVITTDGAPAWGNGLSRVERVDHVEREEVKVKVKGEGGSSMEREGVGGSIWTGYDGRLIYLNGYRDGSPEERIQLLKSAIEGLVVSASNGRNCKVVIDKYA